MPQYRELPPSEAQYLLAHARTLGPAPLRLRPKSTLKPIGGDVFAQHPDAPAVAVKATVAVRPIVNMKVLGKVRRLPCSAELPTNKASAQHPAVAATTVAL